MTKIKAATSFMMVGIAALVVSGFVLGSSTPTGIAMAAPGGTPGAPGSDQGKGGEKSLDKQYERLQTALEHQQARLDKAAKIAEKVQNWIDKNKGKGKDTAGLEAGLLEFNAKIVEAQSFTEQAGALLASHAGFDDQGNVTDAQAARDTIKQVRDLLRSAHKSLTQAVPAMRHAVNDYRHSGQGADNQGKGKGGKPEDKGNKGNKGQGGDDDATETPEPTETSG